MSGIRTFGWGLLALAGALPFASAVSAADGPARYPALRRVYERMDKGERVTLAYLGGSVTWGATSTDPLRTSWRAMITESFANRHPAAHLKAVDASIGGKGSDLGVFRIDRDVIPFKPDLTFVEFAVNDGTQPIYLESFEGVIRKLHNALPDMAIVIVLSGAGRDTFGNDRTPRYAALGERYGLPVADVCRGLVDGIAKGQYKAAEFLTDGVHLNDYGNKLYHDLLLAALDRDAAAAGTPTPWPAAPQTPNRFEKSRMVPVADLIKDSKDWNRSLPSITGAWFDHQPSRKLDSVAVAQKAGAALSIELPCTGAGVYFETLPNGGAFTLAADGNKVFSVEAVMKHAEPGLGNKFEFLPEKAAPRTLTLTADRTPLRLGYLLLTE